MGDIIPFLIIGGVILAIVGGLIFNSIYEKKRTEKISQIAEKMGLSFIAQHDPAMHTELSSFSLFQSGRGRKMKNMVHGDTDDLRIAIFDYQYTTGSGKHKHTHHQTVIAFMGPSLALPQFELKPENLFHKIGGMLGMKDINFDTHPKFSKMFYLRGSDEEAIRRVFRPEVLSLFEQRPGLYVQAAGEKVVYFRAGKRVSAEEYRQLLAEAFELYGLWRSDAA